MNKAFRLLGFSFFYSQIVFCQNPLIKQWDFRFGGLSWDEISVIRQTSDNGFILGGHITGAGGNVSQPSQDSSTDAYHSGDYWIVKSDSNGTLQWEKRFGGIDQDYLFDLQQTRDGGYVLCGFSRSGISGDKSEAVHGGNLDSDYWIIKTDSLGNKQWDKDFGGTSYEEARSMQQTRDGGYIIAGYSASDISGDKSEATKGGYDYWIIKTDSLGNMQWDKDLGGSEEDDAFSIQQTADGGFIVEGASSSSLSSDKTEATQGAYDYWIVKMDSLGHAQWDRDNGGTGNDIFWSLDVTFDGGYILGGASESGASGNKTAVSRGGRDYWIVKIDSSGTKEWDRGFGGWQDEWEVGNITQTADSGYLIAGISESGIGGDKTEMILNQDWQTWILKTKANGDRQWDKSLLNNGKNEYGFAIQSRDGCFVMANSNSGGVSGEKTQPAWNYSIDYWMIKFCETNSLPTAGLTNVPLTICPGNCVSFYNQSQLAGAYQWIFDGAIPSSSNDVSPGFICYPSSGTYDVTLIATNSNGSDTLYLPAFVTVDNPVNPVITQANDTLLATGGFVSYIWYRDTSWIGTGNEFITHEAGTYTVVVTDSAGCQTSTTIESMSADFLSDSLLCPGSCIDFTNLCLNADSCRWDFTGGVPSSSTDVNPSGICYANPGSYDVTLHCYNLNGVSSINAQNFITVFPFPQPQAIHQMGDTLYANSAPVSYQWYRDSIAIAGATEYFYVAHQSGNYSVVCTDGNGCEVEAALYNVIASVASQGLRQIKIFIDPASEFLTVKVNLLKEPAVLKIYDLDGRLIASLLPDGVNQYHMDISGLSSGIYFIQLVTSKELYREKFFKE